MCVTKKIKKIKLILQIYINVNERLRWNKSVDVLLY